MLRKGLLALVVGGIALFSIAGTSAGTAFAAGCPNEALRVGPSALLPECRAYEQVTPVDKEGGSGIFLNGVAQAAPSGEGISFISASAYAEPHGSALSNRYVSSRAGGNWATKEVNGPQAIQELLLIRATFALSENLEYSLTASKEAFTPDAIQGGSNLYLRNVATGESKLVAAAPGNAFFYEMSGLYGAPFVGASHDWSHLLLNSTTALAPGAEAGMPNLYEYADGRLTLAAPPGDAPAAKTSTPYAPFVMSADGNRFFFTDRAGVLYMREGGTKTVPISESKVIPEGEEGHLAPGAFAGATRDGSSVFFLSSADLTGESESNALYRYTTTATGGELTDLTPDSINRDPAPRPTDAAITLTMSEDGEYVYFTAPARLTANAPAVEGSSTNIYVWHGAPGEAGTVRFIAQTDPQNGAEGALPAQYVASPDGRYLAIGTRSPLTSTAAPLSPACPGEPQSGTPAERCMNVFAYSFPTDELDCLTCTGGPSPGDSAVGGQKTREEVFTYLPRGVLNDGTFFFDTPVSLVPRDTNGIGDAYEWRAGQFQLLSTGTADTAATFADSTPDGHDVFIRSAERLVGQDDDSALDVYDVRVDGGIAAQAGSTAGTECSSETSCRSGLAGTPTGAPPASSRIEGAGNVAGRCGKASRRAATAKRHAAATAQRAKKLSGARAAGLRRRAAAEKKKATHLAKRAQICTKGGAR